MPPPPPVNPQRLSSAESRERTLGFFQGLGVDVPLPASAERPDAYSSLVRAIVSSAAVTSSRVSCTITISPAVANQYNTLHGGAVAAVAEAVGMACARAAAGDKEMFLGELSTAYLAAARVNRSALFPNTIFSGSTAQARPTTNSSCQLSRITPAGTPPRPKPIPNSHPRIAGLPEQQSKRRKRRRREMSESDGNPGHKLSPADARTVMLAFFRALGADTRLPASADQPDAYSALVRSILSSVAVSASLPTPRVSCTITVSEAVTNPYNTLHGGVVAAVAEAVGMACARAAAGDREMFLGELSTAYLAAARCDSEVDVEAQILRKGRSVVVTTIDFRLKDTKRLCYTSRATFYIMPVASL